MLNTNTKTAIKLDQELSCEYICKSVQDLVNRFIKQKIDLSNYLLVLELKEVHNTDQSLLLKIGVKQ